MVEGRGTTAPLLDPPRRGAHGVRRRAALAFLCLLALVAGGWSLASGVASVLSLQAGWIGERSPAVGVVPGGGQESAILRILSLARRLDPANPRYREQLALHLERQALQSPPRGTEERHRLLEAYRLSIQAAQQRPTWPLGLTSVLRTSFKIHRFGDEFTRRYARAAALGRSEPAALRALVDLGLVTWPRLDADGQREVRELLRHGLRVNPDYVLARAVELWNMALVEPLIATDADLQRRYAAILAHPARR